MRQENIAVNQVELLLAEVAMVLSRFRHRIPECVRQELGQESVTRALAASAVRVPPAFVRRVARNLAIDWLRGQLGESEDSELLPGSDWQRQVEEHLDLERVRSALSSAPAPYRTLLEALVFEARDLEELISAEMLERGHDPGDPVSWGLARDAVYKRRTRALAWLRRYLGG
jgi:DNA-directed RNA polymerase specialized sigma24 family protein